MPARARVDQRQSAPCPSSDTVDPDGAGRVAAALRCGEDLPRAERLAVGRLEAVPVALAPEGGVLDVPAVSALEVHDVGVDEPARPRGLSARSGPVAERRLARRPGGTGTHPCPSTKRSLGEHCDDTAPDTSRVARMAPQRGSSTSPVKTVPRTET